MVEFHDQNIILSTTNTLMYSSTYSSILLTNFLNFSLGINLNQDFLNAQKFVLDNVIYKINKYKCKKFLS
jgi:hypothetical protein